MRLTNKSLIVLSIVLLAVIGLLGGAFLLTNNSQPASNNESNTEANTETDEPQVISANYAVVDTNQTVCTNATSNTACPTEGSAFYGQDAQYNGLQPRYTDNGDGTVSDAVTGLMWQQDPVAKQDYDEAIAGAADFELAGYDDWRVPTIKELYSLIDFNGTDPRSMDSSNGLIPFMNDDYFAFYFGDTSAGDRIIDSQWVTSSVYVASVMNNQECFFGVNFADGRIKCYPTRAGKGYYSIYVRGDSYGINDFESQGSVVVDNATELTWQQADSGEGMVWEDALAYCENLSLDGYTDWRLPNAKELQSLVDYSRSPDTTNSAAIDPLFTASVIENEAGEADYPFYWSSTTHIKEGGGYSDAAYVSFGRALGYIEDMGGWMDVHGAGAQRSDPKDGDPSSFELGMGPQGDARRIYNYARCVR